MCIRATRRYVARDRVYSGERFTIARARARSRYIFHFDRQVKINHHPVAVYSYYGNIGAQPRARAVAPSPPSLRPVTVQEIEKLRETTAFNRIFFFCHGRIAPFEIPVKELALPGESAQF